MRISPLRIGLLLTGLVILCGLYYVFLFRGASPVTAPLVTSHTTVRVTPIHTDVSIQHGTSPFSVIAEQQEVESGSTIKTSDKGRALIESSSSHITRLDYSSQITISEEQKHTQVSLAGGAVWSRLKNLFDSGETYDVQTPNAIASVRGTSFGVWYQGTTTIVMVLEGAVLFTPIGDEHNAVLVHAGYKATRVGSGPVQVELLTKADRALPWVVFNSDVVAPTTSSPTTIEQPPPPSSGTPLSTPAPAPAPTQDLMRFSGVSPTSVEEGSGSLLTLSGRNLDQVVTVSIDGTSVYFTLLSSTGIQVNTPTSLGVGRHTISVTGPQNRVVSLSNILTVTARTASPNTVTGKP
jgi:FecR protein/IPT/TIG domain